jgi:hypothetical protein
MVYVTLTIAQQSLDGFRANKYLIKFIEDL